VHERVDEIVGLFAAFIGQARAVRRLGSAAIDLCYVAAGRMDGFWERDLKPWDVAAGALIVAEAGGLVTGMDGAPFSSRGHHVLASNGRIHDAMLADAAGEGPFKPGPLEKKPALRVKLRESVDYITAMRRLVPVNAEATLDRWNGERDDETLHMVCEDLGVDGPMKRLLAAMGAGSI
jgi:hypothetical protein